MDWPTGKFEMMGLTISDGLTGIPEFPLPTDCPTGKFERTGFTKLVGSTGRELKGEPEFPAPPMGKSEVTRLMMLDGSTGREEAPGMTLPTDWPTGKFEMIGLARLIGSTGRESRGEPAMPLPPMGKSEVTRLIRLDGSTGREPAPGSPPTTDGPTGKLEMIGLARLIESTGRESRGEPAMPFPPMGKSEVTPLIKLDGSTGREPAPGSPPTTDGPTGKLERIGATGRLLRGDPAMPLPPMGKSEVTRLIKLEGSTGREPAPGIPPTTDCPTGKLERIGATGRLLRGDPTMPFPPIGKSEVTPLIKLDGSTGREPAPGSPPTTDCPTGKLERIGATGRLLRGEPAMPFPPMGKSEVTRLSKLEGSTGREPTPGSPPPTDWPTGRSERIGLAKLIGSTGRLLRGDPAMPFPPMGKSEVTPLIKLEGSTGREPTPGSPPPTDCPTGRLERIGATGRLLRGDPAMPFPAMGKSEVTRLIKLDGSTGREPAPGSPLPNGKSEVTGLIALSGSTGSELKIPPGIPAPPD
ncbi:hypothetical protein MJO29_007490 [Puccinia striiformis f. sp. tritici]|nr:hypothetical protein MJO29_007490 [Puccinia striiformis f. sp. tritici]